MPEFAHIAEAGYEGASRIHDDKKNMEAGYGSRPLVSPEEMNRPPKDSFMGTGLSGNQAAAGGVTLAALIGGSIFAHKKGGIEGAWQSIKGMFKQGAEEAPGAGKAAEEAATDTLGAAKSEEIPAIAGPSTSVTAPAKTAPKAEPLSYERLPGLSDSDAARHEHFHAMLKGDHQAQYALRDLYQQSPASAQLPTNVLSDLLEKADNQPKDLARLVKTTRQSLAGDAGKTMPEATPHANAANAIEAAEPAAPKAIESGTTATQAAPVSGKEDFSAFEAQFQGGDPYKSLQDEFGKLDDRIR